MEQSVLTSEQQASHSSKKGYLSWTFVGLCIKKSGSCGAEIAAIAVAASVVRVLSKLTILEGRATIYTDSLSCVRAIGKSAKSAHMKKAKYTAYFKVHSLLDAAKVRF